MASSIMVSGPVPACLERTETDNHVVGYTGVYNVLDYACVSFPTGLSVDKAVDTPSKEDYQPLSQTCKTIHANCEFAHIISIETKSFLVTLETI